MKLLILIALGISLTGDAWADCQIKTSDGRVFNLNICGAATPSRPARSTNSPNIPSSSEKPVLSAIKNEPLFYQENGSTRTWEPMGSSGRRNLFISEEGSSLYIRLEDPFDPNIRTYIGKGSLGCGMREIRLTVVDQYNTKNQPIGRNVSVNEVIETPELVNRKYCKQKEK